MTLRERAIEAVAEARQGSLAGRAVDLSPAEVVDIVLALLDESEPVERKPIGTCGYCDSDETPVGDWPLTSCISCGRPWKTYASPTPTKPEGGG